MCVRAMSSRMNRIGRSVSVCVWRLFHNRFHIHMLWSLYILSKKYIFYDICIATVSFVNCLCVILSLSFWCIFCAWQDYYWSFGSRYSLSVPQVYTNIVCTITHVMRVRIIFDFFRWIYLIRCVIVVVCIEVCGYANKSLSFCRSLFCQAKHSAFVWMETKNRESNVRKCIYN